MNYKIFIFYLIFNLFIKSELYSQIDTSKYLVKTDTVLVIDTTIKNGTVYITKTYKIKVRIIAKKDSLSKQIKPSANYINITSQPLDIGMFSPSQQHNYYPAVNFSPSFYINFNFSAAKWRLYPYFDRNLKPWFSLQSMATIETYNGNFGAEIGLGVNKFFERFVFNTYLPEIDTNTIMTIFSQQNIDIDTIWFIDLDSLLNGDTVWHPYYDTSYRFTYDTTYNYTYDTTYKSLYYKDLHTYHFIILPIIFKYRFFLQRLWIEQSIGFNFVFFRNAKGIYLNKQNSKYKIKFLAETFNFSIYSLNLLSQTKIVYPLSNKVFLYVGVYCKLPLKNTYIYNNNKINIFSYGLSTGVKFLLK